MSNQVIDWNDDEILKAAAACKTKKAIAESLGIKPTSLANYLGANPALDTKVKNLLREKREIKFDPRKVTDEERLREEQQRAEIDHLRREHRELMAELASREAVVQRIIEEARVPVSVPDFGAPPRTGKGRDGKPRRSAVLPIYDLQYGQLVRPSDTPLGLGKFNAGEIFDERLKRYHIAATSSLRDLAAGHDIEELVFAMGGDFVEGDLIFKGQTWQLDKHPIRQVLDLRVKLAHAVLSIAAYARSLGVKRIAFLAVPGNHGKVGGRAAGATPADYSWDHLLGELLADDLTRDDAEGIIDLVAVEPAGYLLFETGGHRFLMIHGDEVRGHMGIPFYGLTRFDGRALRLAGEDAHFHFCLLGHHHQQSSIPNGDDGRYLMSGDWVGANNLSKHIASATRPQQRLLLVAHKYGITHDVPLYLTLKQERAAPTIHALS